MKIISTLLMLFTLASLGQNLEKHQWKNRVLLIFEDAIKSDKLQQQVEILSEEKEGLLERKLIIYRFSKDKFTTDFNTIWFTSTLDSKKYKKVFEGFQIVLIGLDGDIKMKEKTLLSVEKLFTIIDGMAMRKRELRYKN